MSIVNGSGKNPYIDLGQNYKISLNYAEVLDEKHLAFAKEDLRETPELREQALKELRELIEGRCRKIENRLNLMTKSLLPFDIR
jgi:hypothetical protein